MAGLADFVDQLFGGGSPPASSSEPNAPPPASGLGAAFGSKPVAPEEDIAAQERARKLLTSAGVDPGEIDFILNMTDPAKQDEAVLRATATARRLNAPKAPKQQFSPQGREILKKKYPEIAEIIDSVPDSVLANIVSSQVSKSLNPKAPPKPTKPALNRQKILETNPDLAPFIEGMEDSDIGDVMKARAEQQMKDRAAGGKPEYKTAKSGVRLKVVQDEAFQRSGLKTGDVVCIRI